MPDFVINLILQNEMARRASAAMVADLRKIETAAQQAGRAIDRSNESQARATNANRVSVQRLGESVAGMIGAYAGASGAVMLMQSLGKAVSEAADAQRKMTEEFIRQRDAMREIESMKGGTATGKSVAELAAFGKATGLKPDEAKAFITAFMGSGEQFKERTGAGPGGEYEQFMQQAGKLAAAKGFSPEVIGEFAGATLGMKDYGKFGDRADEMALGDMNAALMILQHGKGQNATMTQQLATVATALVSDDELAGVFKTQSDAAVLVSTMAEYKQNEAEIFSRAAVRAFRSFDDEKKGPLLARAGVGPETSVVDAARLIDPIIRSEAVASGRKIYDVVGEYFTEEREKSAVAALINKGIGEGVIAEREAFAKTVQGPGPALKEIEKFQTDPRGAGIHRMAEAGDFASKMLLGEQNAMVETLRTQAIARMRATGDLDSTSGLISDVLNKAVSPTEWVGVNPGGKEERISAVMAQILQERATAGGLQDFDQGSLFHWISEQGRNAQFRAGMEQMEGAGINPLTGEKTGGAVQILGEIRDRLPAPDNQPATIVAPPPVQPARQPAGWRDRP